MNRLLSLSVFVMLAGGATLVATTRDLAGLWEFRFDPKSGGEAAGWQNSSDAKGWTRTRVPGSYNQLPHALSSYQGKAWYRRDFEVPADNPDGRVVLRFDGIAIRSKIWVNGKFAGAHLFPYNGFELDVTRLVQRGSVNRLVVMADNELLDQAIPDKKLDGWWNFGGINRDVFVETRPSLWAQVTRIETGMGEAGQWHHAFTITVDNHGAIVDGRVLARIDGPDGHTIWRGSRNVRFGMGKAKVEMDANLTGIRPWSPDSPSLYTLHTAVIGDGRTITETNADFGFRTIEANRTGLFLNGQRIFLKGVSVHEMYPEMGMTLTRAIVRHDLEDIKKLGANFVRVTHYPHSRDFYELCDELGLMVWNEIPVWQTDPPVLTKPQVYETYIAPQLEEMIAAFRLHPSVVIWSVANEVRTDLEDVAQVLKKACALVRSLDSTRLVGYASDQDMKDLGFGSADFIAVNEYYGHYYGKLEDLGPVLDAIHRKWPDKPIIVSEFGTESILGWENPGAASPDGSEDFQVQFIRGALAQMIAKPRREFIAGAIYWLYADYPWRPDRNAALARSPELGFNNCKGIVTDDRKHKRSWMELQRFFQSAALSGGNL